MVFQFDYKKNDKVSTRVVEFDGVMLKDTKGKFYFKGLTLSVNGEAPAHPYSTYLESGIVDDTFICLKE